LITRHGASYHSLLAGFGQIDATNGRWLLAGVDDKNPARRFCMKLRRAGRPIDLRSRLASRDDRAEDSSGNSKVRE